MSKVVHVKNVFMPPPWVVGPLLEGLRNKCGVEGIY